MSHIVFLLDASWSMASIHSATVKSMNTFIKEQQELEGKMCKFTLISFNTDSDKLVENKNIEEVELLQEKEYVPNGTTALYDTIKKYIEEYDKEKNVMFVILTDGEDNSSKTNRKDVFNLISKKTKEDGWNFHYLGANVDCFKEASSMNIQRSTPFKATPDGISQALSQCSFGVSNWRKSV